MATTFPNPLLLALPRLDAVFEFIWLIPFDAQLHGVPYRPSVGGVDDVSIQKPLRPGQFGAAVAGQLKATAAEEFHRPIRQVQTAIGHARQTIHECGKTSLAFAQQLFGPLPVSDVLSRAEEPDRRATLVAGDFGLISDPNRVPVAADSAVLNFVPVPRLQGSRHCVSPTVNVLGVFHRLGDLIREFHLARFEAEDSESVVRPGYLPRPYVPFPVPNACDSLGLGQICLGTAQRLVGFLQLPCPLSHGPFECLGSVHQTDANGPMDLAHKFRGVRAVIHIGKRPDIHGDASRFQ